MSKNVLIVTMPASDNYGNRLQNYATEHFLTDLGYTCTTLRVRPGDHWDDSVRPEQSLLKKLTPGHIKRFLARKRVQTYQIKDALQQQRQDRFDEFDRKHVHMTDYCVGASNFPMRELDRYDFAVCGSDQIWNPAYHYTDIYYMSFMPEHKRVALSPSIGIDSVAPYYQSYMRAGLNGIPYLSVREQSGADIIESLTGRKARVLQDPTLWTCAQDWREIAAPLEDMPQKPYLLCYFLGEQTKEYRRHIERYANENNLDIVSIADRKQPQYFTCGPSEFVYLVDHASLVCTDSFHGVAFSLIFRTPFVTFERTDGKSMNTRITGIMAHVGVDRRLQSVPYRDVLQMDFTGVGEILDKDREAAIDYLQHAAAEIERTNKMPTLAEHDYCNGCRACQVACPVGAIAWEQDAEGFYRPRLNADACIGCGKCQSVCHVHNRALDCTDEYPEAVAAWAKDTEIRTQSSSGGLFSVLAGEILQRGGVVFGAGFDDQWHVRHRYIERIEQLPLLRTSKYVQSDVGDCYARAKEFLEADRWVYFSGTPCQIQGLRAYLGKDYDKLILQDIVCHGVPSERAWDAYLDQVHGGADAVGAVNFRDKKQGWKLYGMRIELGNALTYETERDQDAYMKAFLSNLDLRPSCYNCVNKTAKRNCDVTLADYWGIERVHPEIDAEPGVSLVLLQSEKGKRLLEDVSDKIQSIKTDAKQALQYNASAITSVKKIRGKRGAFFAGYQEDFATCVEKINRVSLYRRAYGMLGRIKYRVIKIFKK
ncbi:MAG: 4Fe-4S dicluster domain-containing protein [Ruminococcaceae bacterium]|nr:4Fe-4S dicluster domain-containing protein [Oscillospiraceae bacterium]